jgi:hypothetical protein
MSARCALRAARCALRAARCALRSRASPRHESRVNGDGVNGNGGSDDGTSPLFPSGFGAALGRASPRLRGD